MPLSSHPKQGPRRRRRSRFDEKPEDEPTPMEDEAKVSCPGRTSGILENGNQLHLCSLAALACGSVLYPFPYFGEDGAKM